MGFESTINCLQVLRVSLITRQVQPLSMKPTLPSSIYDSNLIFYATETNRQVRKFFKGSLIFLSKWQKKRRGDRVIGRLSSVGGLEKSEILIICPFSASVFLLRSSLNP